MEQVLECLVTRCIAFEDCSTSNVKKLAKAVDKVKVRQFSTKQGMEFVTDEKACTLNLSTTSDDSEIEVSIKIVEEGRISTSRFCLLMSSKHKFRCCF